MKKALVFREYDQAVMFKILNDLPKDTKPIAESFRKTILVRKGKVIKMDVSDRKGREWIL